MSPVSLARRLAAAVLLAAACAPAAEVPRPSVLLIVWDTVRADRLGCYGGPRDVTPELDRLAERSTLFERAISPGIWTVPGHASLFTGLPVSAHGASTAYAWLEDDFETLAETFAGGGWETWAFSANPFVDHATTNLAQGFATLEHPWSEAWKERFAARDDAPAAGEMDRSNAFWSAGEVAGEALAAWLDGREGDAPFFAFVNLMEAHMPRNPSDEARRRAMEPDEIEAARGLEGEALNLVQWMLDERECSETELELIRATYDASLFDLDRWTGALVAELERRGLLEDTVVVITSDHGENLGERGLFDHKFCVYDTLVRVPLIVHHPRALEPARVSETVSTLDLHATLLDLAGLEAPQGHGRSLVGRANGERDVHAEMIASMPKKLLRAARSGADLDWTRWSRKFQTIERDGWKLIRSSDGELELFEVSADPGEERDRAAEQPRRAAELSAAIDAWRASFHRFDPAVDGRRDKARELPEDLLEQLSDLGYIGLEEDDQENR